jgi:small subunit ribosomal protein S7e
LEQLSFITAKEVEISGGRSAIVVFVPFRLLSTYHRIQARLVHELEKKFSGKHVLFVAQRRVLKKSGRNNRIAKQKRPTSRTLTAVHEAILDDVVYPAEIAGKRLRYKKDSSVTKV